MEEGRGDRGKSKGGAQKGKNHVSAPPGENREKSVSLAGWDPPPPEKDILEGVNVREGLRLFRKVKKGPAARRRKKRDITVKEQISREESSLGERRETSMEGLLFPTSQGDTSFSA